MVTAMCRLQLKDRKEVDVGFEGNIRSVGYDKQCSLVWSLVEERGLSCLQKGFRL